VPGDGFQRLTEQVEELGFAVVQPEQLVAWNHST
jgi:hypothetical protein